MERPIVTEHATLWPVSIKGVVHSNDEILLAYNERCEWELLGGKLEIGEDPASTAAREVLEESGLIVDVGRILDSWIYRIDDQRSVLIVTYDCPLETLADISISAEHSDLRWFNFSEVTELPIPQGYVRSIASAVRGQTFETG